jgi:hypothetical protein
MVIVGGMTGDYNETGDDPHSTWVWTPGDDVWTLMPSAPFESGSTSASIIDVAMTAHPYAPFLYAYGGDHAPLDTLAEGSMWQWDGSNWNEQQPYWALGMMPRAGAAMALSADYSWLIIQGGRWVPYTGAALDEVWFCPIQGSGCYQSQLSGAPSARFGHSMVTNPITFNPMLFGGGPALYEWWTWDPPVTDQTWVAENAWNPGSISWTQVLDLSPGSRWYTVTAYHNAQRRTFMFGGRVGFDASAVANDLWTFRTRASGCGSPSDCETGYCIDGVCCASRCGVCEACGGDGLCAPVTGPDPDSCPAPLTCEVHGTVGVCAKANGATCAAGTECASGYCVDGVCCNTTCTGQCQSCNLAGALGTCSNLSISAQSSGRGGACSPNYVCSGGADCPVGCSTDQACAATRYCDSTGHCVPRKAQGIVCDAQGGPGHDCLTANCRVCTSGNCVDGRCCNAACNQGCQACSVAAGAATNGTCATVQSQQPGRGACGGFLCGGATACPTTCADNSWCYGAGVQCLGGVCVGSGQYPNGTPCSSGTQCEFGQCVDGVCCDQAVCGTCERCNVAASAGTCHPVAGADADSCTAPASCAVVTIGAATIGVCGLTNGSACGGDGDCQSTHCVDGVCCDSACTGACQSCGLPGEAGTCLPVPLAAGSMGRTGQCAPYLCDGASPFCPGTCASDDYCAPGEYCDGTGHCQLTKAQGATCDTSAGANCLVAGCRVCDPGACVDGVCCDGSCAGGCQACAVSAGAVVDGVCQTVATHAVGRARCGLFLCGGDVDCPTTCQADADCTGSGGMGVHCVDHECRGVLPLGFACTKGKECGSGNCVDGLCCDAACDGACVSCNQPGHEGSCTVTATPEGSDCTGEGHCAGSCAGTSFADAHCAYPGDAQSCGLCLVCDGNGKCSKAPPSGEDTSCASAACDDLMHGECWVYEVPMARACDAPGVCKSVMDGACTVRVLDDGTACSGGSCAGGVCQRTTDVAPATGCSAAPRAESPPAIAWLFALAFALARRRKRA